MSLESFIKYAANLTLIIKQKLNEILTKKISLANHVSFFYCDYVLLKQLEITSDVSESDLLWNVVKLLVW